MALTVTVTPGKRFAATEKITIPKLNQLGLPTFLVTGTMGTSEISDASITGDKTVPSDHFYAESVAFAAGVFTLTYTPAPTIVEGMIIAFKASAPGVPDSVNGVRIKIGASTAPLLKHKTERLVGGDIVLNQIVEARYDSAAGAWQMTSQLGNSPTLYTTDVSGSAASTPNTYTLTLTPPAFGNYTFTADDFDGRRIRFKVPYTNTAVVQIRLQIGGVLFGPKNLYKHFNQPLVANDLRQYQIAEIVYEKNTVASTDAFQLLSQSASADPNNMIIASGRNIVLENNAATPDSQLNIAADEVVLRNTENIDYLARSVNVTVNIAATAGNANALDTGSETLSTWYYVWLIYNPTTAVVSGLLSLSSTGPTMPTDYTYKALVGVVRNDASSNFLRFYQTERRTFLPPQLIFTARAAGTADVWEILGATPADLTNFRAAVPPIAKMCYGIMGATATEASIGVAMVNSDGSVSSAVAGAAGLGATYSIIQPQGNVWEGYQCASAFTVGVRGGATNYNIQWKCRFATTAVNRIQINGFSF